MPIVRPHIILASASPRRKELLASLGLTFRVFKPSVKEHRAPRERPRAFARRMACAKARWASRHIASPRRQRSIRFIIIAADTIVTRRGMILGKPRHTREARRMLRLLSGHTHEVITGLCLRGQVRSGSWKEISRVVSTRVTFKKLDGDEITAYLRTGEPMDKAGAYAIQGKAAYMIQRVRGSYTNVVGLPLTELCDLLTNAFDVPVFPRKLR